MTQNNGSMQHARTHTHTHLQYTHHTHPLIVTDRAERAAFSHHHESFTRKRNWGRETELTGERKDWEKMTNRRTDRDIIQDSSEGWRVSLSCCLHPKGENPGLVQVWDEQVLRKTMLMMIKVVREALLLPEGNTRGWGVLDQDGLMRSNTSSTLKC